MRAATAETAAAVVLVGHSGAGLLLPAIADALTVDVAALVFVDSFLPPASGSLRLAPAGLMSQLRALASDGVLPPWSSWFGEDAMRELVPEERLRATLEEEMPRLPLSYFEASVPLPGGWSARPCAYLLFGGEPYAKSAAQARDQGWAVAEISGVRPGLRRRSVSRSGISRRPYLNRAARTTPTRVRSARRAPTTGSRAAALQALAVLAGSSLPRRISRLHR